MTTLPTPELSQAGRSARPIMLRLSLAGLASLGAVGVTPSVVFSDPSLLKLLLATVAPLVLLGLIEAQRRLTWSVASLIVLAPFTAYTITLQGLAVPVAVPLFGMPLILSLAASRRHGHANGSRDGARLLAAALVLLALMSFAHSAHLGAGLLLLLTIVLTFGLVRAAVRESGSAPIIAAILTSSAIQGALALIEYATGNTISLYGSSALGGQYAADYFYNYGSGVQRTTAAYYDPISLGNVLAIAIPFAVVAIVRALHARHFWHAALATAVLAVVGAGLLTTLSRGSWVASAAAVLVLALTAPRALRGVALATTAVLASATVLAFTLAGAAGLNRLSSILDPTAPGVITAQGDQDREQFWSVSWRVATEHPFFGVGFGDLNSYLLRETDVATQFTHAHSTYLQVFAEMGGLALAALAALLVTGALRAMHARNSSIAGWPATAALVAVAICWFTDFTVRYTAVAVAMTTVFALCFFSAETGSDSGLIRVDDEPGDLPEGCKNPSVGRTP